MSNETGPNRANCKGQELHAQLQDLGVNSKGKAESFDFHGGPRVAASRQGRSTVGASTHEDCGRDCSLEPTLVINIKSGEPWDVYIGRASLRASDPRCRVGSEWANPFKVRQVGMAYSRARVPGDRLCNTVEEALAKYEAWLRKILAVDPGARPRLLALKGKRLGCWCKPAPCHGDVLVRLIDELERGGGE